MLPAPLIAPVLPLTINKTAAKFTKCIYTSTAGRLGPYSRQGSRRKGSIVSGSHVSSIRSVITSLCACLRDKKKGLRISRGSCKQQSDTAFAMPVSCSTVPLTRARLQPPARAVALPAAHQHRCQADGNSTPRKHLVGGFLLFRLLAVSYAHDAGLNY